MKKKLIIILSVVLAFIVLVVVLSCTVFTLKEVRFVFLNETSESIDPPASFDFDVANDCIKQYLGENIVFLNENKVIEKLSKSMYEYRCIDSVRAFPDSLTIYFAQRKAVYYIADNMGNGGYIADQDMFVFDRYNGEAPDAIRILSLDEDIKEIVEGQEILLKCDNDWKSDIFKEVARTLWMLGYSYSAQSDFLNIAQIVVGDNENSFVLELETSMGGKFVIANPKKNLSNRIIAAYGVFIDSKAAKDAEYIVSEDGKVSERT